MITVTQELASQLSSTSRLICMNSLERGWIVETPYLTSPHLFIDRGDGRKLHVFSATPPTVSYASAHLVNDKYATSVLLADAGIVQLPTMLLDESLLHEDTTVEFIRNNGPVVVKPIDGGHGKGITVGIDTVEQLEDAYRYALEHVRTMKRVVLQKQLVSQELHDIRIAVVADKVIAAIERIPARVRGDGVHTISELIEIENQQEYRGEPYSARLARIDSSRAMMYLGDASSEILPKDEWRYVLPVANYGAGGELVDVTDDIPEWMREESVKAAQTLRLDVAGVDYLINQPLHASLTRLECEGVITEVNKCPALSIHDEPTVGKNRHATEAYLDFIETL